MHTVGYDFPCPNCESKFKVKRILLRHIEGVHNKQSDEVFHIGAQTILVTNLVTNSVTNLSPNLVITKQSDNFVTLFVTKIGVHLIW